MAELLNNKRAFFPLGKQRAFLLQSKNDLHYTWEKLAALSKTSVRNLTGWKNENNSMSLLAIKRICKKRSIGIPKSIVIRDAYWYTKKGAQAGGRALVKKYGIVGGDQEYRKKKWREWWEKYGKFKPSKITQALPFKKPKFSEDLAEFVGIMLGDGGISERQLTVTLHRVTDKKYSLFVRRLIRKLFEIQPGEYCDRQFLANSIVISRTGLVKYCIEKLGLKKGNKIKQRVDIPHWIKEKKRYWIACLRGLIDTDGSIIIHRYFSKGKMYCYTKIGFTSRSRPLLLSVSAILLNIGIKHRIMKNGWDIRIEAKESVAKYFRLIGTHNPKHIKRHKMA